jgi:hypothetical protein
MAKKLNAGRPENQEAPKAFGTPPLLSEKLIAQLQGAVSAAQRKRVCLSERQTDSHDKPAADES